MHHCYWRKYNDDNSSCIGRLHSFFFQLFLDSIVFWSFACLLSKISTTIGIVFLELGKPCVSSIPHTHTHWWVCVQHDSYVLLWFPFWDGWACRCRIVVAWAVVTLVIFLYHKTLGIVNIIMRLGIVFRLPNSSSSQHSTVQHTFFCCCCCSCCFIFLSRFSCSSFVKSLLSLILWRFAV